MFSEPYRTVPVARGYVKKWLVLSAVVGGVIPLALIGIMWRFGFDPALALGVVAPSIILSWVLYRTYKQGLNQAIHLFSNKIVFDYITYKQEFAFESVDDWTLTKQGDNWKLIAVRDQSSKLIPKSAFPSFWCRRRLETALIWPV